MLKLLLVVDVQNDFVNGALGSYEASKAAVEVANKIKDWEDAIIVTLDTHDNETYLQSNEGKHLPVVHCIKDSHGWELNRYVREQLKVRDAQAGVWEKSTFGDYELADFIRNHGFDYIEICGLCTDICVISNALLLKSYLPEATIVVDAAACAGTSIEAHKAALMVMKNCHIDIINEE